MQRFFKISTVLVFVSCLATSVYAEVVDRIMAVVNRKVITLYQLQQAEKAFPQRPNTSETPEAKQARVLNLLIEDELIRQKAEEEGILVSEEDLKAALTDIKQQYNLATDEQFQEAVRKEGRTWEEFLEDIRKQIKVAKLVNREVHATVEVSEAEVEAFYREHPDLFEKIPPTLRIGQILLKVPENPSETDVQAIKTKAEQLVQQLRSGADFATLAKEQSEHPSAASGGELGTFKQGELAAPFDIAFEMDAGAISDPVQSAQGFHIIHVEEKISGDKATYENVKTKIWYRLVEEKSGERYKQWMTDLKEQAYIDIK